MKPILQYERYNWVQGSNVPYRIFRCTKVILYDDKSDFYIARASRRMWDSIHDIDISQLKISAHPIPYGDMWPEYQEEFTLAPSPTPNGFHKKVVQLSEHRSQYLLQEIKVCEILKKHPHPNVAEYRGCMAEHGLITGLCFTAYHQTLSDRMYHDTRPFNIQACLRQIGKGLAHLHSLRLAHNDVKPANIMLDKNDNVFIIDFNSCCEIGSTEGVRGTPLWIDDSYNSKRARRENDYCGLRKIGEWIRDPRPFFLMPSHDKKKHERLGHHGQYTARECPICQQDAIE